MPTGFSWFKLNANQRGFFRVNYIPEHWDALAKALGTDVSVMKASDRWGVIDDSFSLSAAGSLPYSTALDLVQYIKNDRHPVPWSAASSKLSYISSLIYITNLYPGFRVSFPKIILHISHSETIYVDRVCRTLSLLLWILRIRNLVGMIRWIRSWTSKTFYLNLHVNCFNLCCL